MARQAEWWQFLFVPLYAVPIWWIAAGIGIRLGVMPSDFFRSIAQFAGLLDPPSAETPQSDHAPPADLIP